MNSVAMEMNDAQAARSRALYIIAVASFPLLLAGFFTLLVFISGAVERDDGIGHKSEFAQFNYPVLGDLVSDRFELTGTVKSIPLGNTVYLAEMSEGRYWPKKRFGSAPIEFSREQFTSAGAGYKYSVVLLSVGTAGKEQIENWFAHGRKTGKYPGIASLDDATTLARIRVIRR